MKKEEYHKILDQHAEWEMGVSRLVVEDPKPNRVNQILRPEEGCYEVVHRFKASNVPCEWCGEATSGAKTYSRDSQKDVWKAKCREDGCKEKRIIDADEFRKMVSDSRNKIHNFRIL